MGHAAASEKSANRLVKASTHSRGQLSALDEKKFARITARKGSRSFPLAGPLRPRLPWGRVGPYLELRELQGLGIMGNVLGGIDSNPLPPHGSDPQSGRARPIAERS